ncbi:PqqD family protein [Listeria monocytogenes]|nr:PqqD family protein [Listeria monocytogenes]
MISINPFVVTKTQQNEVFIILENNVFHFQGIAKDIWNFISEQDACTNEVILDFILNEYDVNEKKASKDISKLLSQLEKEDIITID